MIAYLFLLYHSPEGGVMAYILEWSGCTYHFVRQTLLQHTQPAPSYSVSTACTTLYVPTLCICHVSTHTTYVRVYVCTCAPVPHVIVFKQFASLIYSLAHIQYMQTYRQRYYKYMQTRIYTTKQTKRQKQLLNTPR